MTMSKQMDDSLKDRKAGARFLTAGTDEKTTGTLLGQLLRPTSALASGELLGQYPTHGRSSAAPGSELDGLRVKFELSPGPAFCQSPG